MQYRRDAGLLLAASKATLHRRNRRLNLEYHEQEGTSTFTR